MSTAPTHDHPLLRSRGHEGGRVSFAELFFDLIYVFSVTQLSHYLLHHLSLGGLYQTLLMWFAVWLGWQYTCWVTNWFNPDTIPIRLLLFAIMLVGLVLGAALPEAFGERGLLFGVCLATIQVGRSLFVLYHLGPRHALTPNFQRILGWTCIAALFWVAGGLVEPQLRTVLWTIAVLCEYVSPMFGFWLPGIGRSSTEHWTIDGHHLAERCQLFIIVALGESILLTGATISNAKQWDAPTLIAFVVAFVGSLAMWWMYFDTSSEDGSHVIAHSDDPGRIGAYFHYVHVIIVAGVIACAVGADLIIAHPHGHIEPKYLAVLVGGPAIYLLGNALYKRVVYGRWPLSHLAGLGVLGAMLPLASHLEQLTAGALGVAVLLVVAIWEGRVRRGTRAHAITA